MTPVQVPFSANPRKQLREQAEIILQGLDVPGEPHWEFLRVHAEQLLQHCHEASEHWKRSA